MRITPPPCCPACRYDGKEPPKWFRGEHKYWCGKTFSLTAACKRCGALWWKHALTQADESIRQFESIADQANGYLAEVLKAREHIAVLEAMNAEMLGEQVKLSASHSRMAKGWHGYIEKRDQDNAILRAGFLGQESVSTSPPSDSTQEAIRAARALCKTDRPSRDLDPAIYNVREPVITLRCCGTLLGRPHAVYCKTRDGEPDRGERETDGD